MAFRILKIRRGLKSALPTLQTGEFAFCTDTKELFIGTASGNLLLSAEALINKLNGIATGATKVLVDSSLSSTSTNAIQNKVVNAALNEKASASALTGHTGSTGIHVTSTEKSNWNGAKGVADNVVKTWGTFTLSASSWSVETGTGYVKQTLAVSGMAAAHNPAMVPVYTSLALSANEKKGFGLIIDATTTAGYVTVRCSEAPTVALKFKLIGV